MPDRISVSLRLGSWIDEAENRGLASLGEIDVYPGIESSNEFVEATLTTVREAELNPWAHEFRESAYYANAGGSSWTLVVDIAPFITGLLSIETARTVAGAFLGALFGRLLGRPNLPEDAMQQLDLEAASQRVIEYMTRRDDLAPSQITELSAGQLEDRSFEFIVRRETDGHRFLFRLDEIGLIIGRIDLEEYVIYSARMGQASEVLDE